MLNVDSFVWESLCFLHFIIEHEEELQTTF